jgi:hypothetical protein
MADHEGVEPGQVAGEGRPLAFVTTIRRVAVALTLSIGVGLLLMMGAQ